MDKEVTVSASVMRYEKTKKQIVTFSCQKSCEKEELMAVALAKLKAHNKADMKTIEQYVLLYPDATVVEKLCKSDAPFILHKCFVTPLKLHL